MADIVQKLWGFCHTLRHDGVDYGDYIVFCRILGTPYLFQVECLRNPPGL